ncbi:MAG: TlpA family protein disulfide reductase, partial [Candidatus Kariarchaeaceae archaeon]
MMFLTINTADGYLLKGTFTDLNGNEIPYEIFEGRLLLVEGFWTECSAWIQIHPELNKIYQEYQNIVEMVSVAVFPADTIATVTQFKVDHPTPWGIGIDTDGELAGIFNIQYTPTLLLFNLEGRRLYENTGYMSYNDIKAVLEAYLSIPNPQPSDSVTINFGNGDD